MASVLDPTGASWNPLYRTAGVAGLLFVLCGITALTIYAVAPPPISGGEATLRFIAEHTVSYIVLQVLWLVPALFGLVVFVGLFVALFTSSPVMSVLGLTVGGASFIALLAVPVTSQGTLSLVFLSDRFTAASPAEQATFSAAAEALVAENNTPSIAGVVTPLGILLISLAMVRGGLPHWVGWLGVVTGALGLAGEALRFAMPAIYAVYGPLLWAWFAIVGVVLLRLPARRIAPPQRRCG
ncbi:DUF4386 family protein [Agromyces aurantiacus]|uniref:DUF4386 family protein n=1 Tax=Agromyces aurantiacus TaxID=165814 RepID=A0ABV9R9M5_9MICO|nr:DUF4386 family protein [Agromyces aurantiacus]MBM7503522.1 hypothetical protein [Agromyces aurantiacus]